MIKYSIDVNNCLSVLNRGGLILYPTDTVWGIGCDPCNENAINRIYRLKQRDESKSMIILVGEEEDILNYTDYRDIKIFDYIKGIQKPTTVIFPAAKNLAKNLINSDGSIAIRLVKDDFCKTLIKAFEKPIVSTSSNISGFPTPSNFYDIDILIKDGVDYVVQHRQDDDTYKSPSTIIRIAENDQIEIIRP